MPELARIVNSIFIAERKQTLSILRVEEKVKFIGFRSVRELKTDIKRLVQISSGWLTEIKPGWLRRDELKCINTVCDSMTE